MTSENITLRQKHKKSSSCEQVNSLCISSPSLSDYNNSITDSLPDKNTDDDYIRSLKDKISSLTSQLDSAHQQIDELLLENGLINKTLQEQERKITYLKTICTGTPLSRTNSMRKKRDKKQKQCRKTIDFAMDYDENEDHNSQETLSQPLLKSYHQNSTNTHSNDNQTDQRPHVRAKEPSKMKPRIIILGDEQVRGLAQLMIKSRQNKWNNCYSVTAMVKPGANCSQFQCNSDIFESLLRKILSSSPSEQMKRVL